MECALWFLEDLGV